MKFVEYVGIMGGSSIESVSNEIQYTTIASEGNAIDFGDLSIMEDKLDVLLYQQEE